MRAWDRVPPEVIEAARLAMSEDQRPHAGCVQFVGFMLAFAVKPSTGFADLTQQQLVERSKGAWSVDQVKRACQVLDRAGVFVVVKQGHPGTAGQLGSGSWRVLSTCDPHGLIAQYKPARLTAPTSHPIPAQGEPMTAGETPEVGAPDRATLSDNSTNQAPAKGAPGSDSTTAGCVPVNAREVWNQPRLPADHEGVRALVVAVVAGMKHAGRGTTAWDTATLYAQDQVTLWPEVPLNDAAAVVRAAMQDTTGRCSRSQRVDALQHHARLLQLDLPPMTDHRPPQGAQQ